MTASILIFSMLLVMIALMVMARAIFQTRSEIRQTTRTGSESIARLREAVDGIRKDEERLRDDLVLLSEVLAAWPQAAAVVTETRLLSHNIRVLGTVIALISALRKAT